MVFNLKVQASIFHHFTWSSLGFNFEVRIYMCTCRVYNCSFPVYNFRGLNSLGSNLNPVFRGFDCSSVEVTYSDKDSVSTWNSEDFNHNHRSRSFHSNFTDFKYTHQDSNSGFLSLNWTYKDPHFNYGRSSEAYIYSCSVPAYDVSFSCTLAGFGSFATNLFT